MPDKERFDAELRPHSHAICSCCGKIVDVWDVALPESIVEEAQERMDFAIDYSKSQFFGVCAECREKNKKAD